MAQTDRFEMKEIKRQMEKKKAKSKGEKVDSSKNEMKSSKFFNRMQDVVKDDHARKESKKRAKTEGGNVMPLHNNQSSKKFKL